MSAKSEREAAYFTLLRAQAERDDLLRYQQFLEDEGLRLEGFVDQTRALVEPVSPRVRRGLDATQKPMVEAVGRRRTVVADELRRCGPRLAAAEAFVEECEQDLAAQS